MPALLVPGLHKPDPDVLLCQRLLARAGYDSPIHGFYEQKTQDAVWLFQQQHVGPDGEFLTPDHKVGGDTWWALEHSSGMDQQSGHAVIPWPKGLHPERTQLLEMLSGEYAKNVFEKPDGSNRGPWIDGYWGDSGLLGQPWCAAFVSEMLRRLFDRHVLGRHHTSVWDFYEAAQARGLLTTTPLPGDIFLQLHPSRQGHMGFGVGFDRTGRAPEVATIEGNCGNRLKNGRRGFNTIDKWVCPFRDDFGTTMIWSQFDVPDVEELSTR